MRNSLGDLFKLAVKPAVLALTLVASNAYATDRHQNGGSSANAEGGAASSNVTFQDKRDIPVGNPASAAVHAGGDCGAGISFSVSGPYLGLSIGNTEQDKDCLADRAAGQILDAGLRSEDPALIATGVGALMNNHEAIRGAAERVLDTSASCPGASPLQLAAGRCPSRMPTRAPGH